MHDLFLVKKFISCTLAITLTFAFSYGVKSQITTGIDTFRVSQIKLSAKLKGGVLWYRDNTHAVKPEQIPELPFRDTIAAVFSKRVPRALVQQDVYLKFMVQNLADTSISFFFVPGYYYKDIQLFKLSAAGNSLEKINNTRNEPLGFRKIKLKPLEFATLFAKLQFVKTSINTLEPALIRDYYLDSYISNKKSEYGDSNIITFVFSGILMMMILYSIAVSFRNKNPEFLLYAVYAFCLGLMLFLKSYFFKTPSHFYYFFESYLDFVMQSFGTFIYLAFLRKFINAKTDFPGLYHVFWAEQVITITSLLLFSYFYFFTDNYYVQDGVEVILKYIWSLGTLIFVIYALRKNNKLLNYLAIGHTFLLTGGLISLYLILSPARFRHLPPLLDNALIYYELGLGCELMFFLVALAYKNKEDIVVRTKERERLKLKNEMQEFEKQLAILSAQQEERNRISADMHDELGSGVTAIRLMSELVKSKMKLDTLPEINKISIAANELINKMNTLIWTMKSEHDSLESLATYIRIYALEFFESTSINCVVKIPASFPKVELSGGKRRNIFLCVKESLNNVLKHSRAEKVTIDFKIGEKLIITIKDNGTGIDFQHLRQFSNGLSNMKKRIESIEGMYTIENIEGSGVQTTMELKI